MISMNAQVTEQLYRSTQDSRIENFHLSIVAHEQQHNIKQHEHVSDKTSKQVSKQAKFRRDNFLFK
jgi:hypothetical protein